MNIEGWEKEEAMFTVTRATEYVAKLIEKEDVVVVTGSSGSGKSSIIHYVALELNKKKGYDIITFISCPADIIQIRDMKKNQVFVVDDICGKNFINKQDLQTWYDKADEIKQLLQPDKTDKQEAKEEKHGHMKIMVSCRLDIFKDTKFKSLKIFTEHVCDLESKKHQLNHDERLKMLKKYTNLSENDIWTLGKMLDKYPYFPLLCKMSEEKKVKQVTEITKSPIKSIMNDIKIRIEINNLEFCALVLCVLFSVGFDETYINPRRIPENIKQKVTNIVNNFKINLGVEMERKQLSDTYKRLDGSYIKKIGSVYTIAHDKLYDMVAVACGQKLHELFIEYAPSSFMAEKFRFKSDFPGQDPEQDDSYLYLSEDDEHLYFDRIFKDLKEQDEKFLFNNQQLKEQSFEDKVMTYIKQNKESCKTLFLELDDTCMKTVIKDNLFMHSYHYITTPLIEASKIGFFKLDKYLILIKCNLNKKDSCYNSSLYYSCINGHLNIVKLLIFKGGNIQEVSNEHKNLLYHVCEGGHTDIVQLLLDRNADVSQCDKWLGQTPLYVACEGGHTEIVQLLLDRNADVLQYDKSGRTPLHVACKGGHTDTVQSLLDRNANFSKCDKWSGLTPLYAACEGGHTDIVQLLLLDRNADLSKCDEWSGLTPLFVACEGGHTDTVQLLLDRNADLSQCDKSGRTPMHVACKGGHTDIVQLLLDRNGKKWFVKIVLK